MKKLWRWVSLLVVLVVLVGCPPRVNIDHPIVGEWVLCFEVKDVCGEFTFHANGTYTQPSYDGSRIISGTYSIDVNDTVHASYQTSAWGVFAREQLTINVDGDTLTGTAFELITISGQTDSFTFDMYGTRLVSKEASDITSILPALFPEDLL